MRRQDIVILLKIISIGNKVWQYRMKYYSAKEPGYKKENIKEIIGGSSFGKINNQTILLMITAQRKFGCLNSPKIVGPIIIIHFGYYLLRFG